MHSPAGVSRRWADHAAVPLILLALWLLATLGARPLLMPDEGRYGEVARAMLTGDTWVPTLAGLPFFHKPPLFYWIDLLAMRLTGVNVFSARAGAVVGAWLMGASLYLYARAHWNARVARLALAILATCPLFYVSAQYANLDMLVAGCISAAAFALVRAVESEGSAALRWVVVGWLACAAGMLAKGLIGFVLPALVVGPWVLATGRWRRLGVLLHPLGVLSGIVVAAPWFVAMQLRYPEFVDYFFLEQHVRRFASTGFNNVQPWWFFAVLLPLLTLPWSAWLLVAWRSLRGWPLLVWWVVAVVAFFSLPQSKLIGYVLPALAPWALLLAVAIEARPLPWLRRCLGLAAATCLLLVAALAWWSPTGARTIGRVLAAQMAAGDQVLMVDAPQYDVAFYAGLARPAPVASEWTGTKALQTDGWRKELTDAARFDPTQAQTMLLPLSDPARRPCGTGTLWLVVPAERKAWVAALPQAQPVLAQKALALWRAPLVACAG